MRVDPTDVQTDDTGRVPLWGSGKDDDGNALVYVPLRYYERTLLEEVVVEGKSYYFTAVDDYSKRAIFTAPASDSLPPGDADSSAAGYVTVGPVS